MTELPPDASTRSSRAEAGLGDAGGADAPPELARAVALDLVTRYRLRLTDPGDSRLGDLAGEYRLGTAQWTGRRSAFVGFYHPPPGPEAAARDLLRRVELAGRWGAERIRIQGSAACDILLVALGPLPRRAEGAPEPPPGVFVGVLAADPDRGAVATVIRAPRGLPGAGEVRRALRALAGGSPAPTLAAVDLAERQTVSGGTVQPVRRALVQRPLATWSLIAGLVAAYVAETVVINHFGTVACGVGRCQAVSSVDLAGLGAGGAGPGDWWRTLGYAVLHSESQPFHLVTNCLALFFVGRIVEQLYGRLVLVGVLVLTAVAGGAVYLGAGDLGLTHGVTVGASGGIAGLVGLLIVVGRVQGRDMPAGVAASVRNYALIVVVLTAVLGAIGAFRLSVNNWVHAGGFVAGVLLGLVLPPLPELGGRPLRRVERALLVAGLAAGAVALSFAVLNVAVLLGRSGP